MLQRSCSSNVALRHRPRRRGNIVVLAALLLVFVVTMVAFAVDLGYLCLVRTELHRAADAGALAGAGALYNPIETLEVFEYYSLVNIDDARDAAQEYVQLNGAAQYKPYQGSGDYLYVDRNAANAPSGDVVLGQLNNPSDLRQPLLVTETNPNSVQVRIPMAQQHPNGTAGMFFARVLGMSEAELAMTATATITNLPVILPITTSLPHWNTLANSPDDEYVFENGQVVNGSDGIPEISIYPGTWDGNDMPPGNFGTVQIGSDSGTSILRGQIDVGPTADDFDYYGGSLYAGMELVGETGISADIETAFVGGPADGRSFSGIIGQTRFMPLYNGVTGNGHNARFQIIKFVAVRIMDANLKGKPKRVVVQPVLDSLDLVPSVRLTR